jgi:hypothetical protein
VIQLLFLVQLGFSLSDSLNKSGIEFDEGGDEEFIVILFMVFFEIARIVGQTVLSVEIKNVEIKNDGAEEKVKLDHSSTQTDEQLKTVVTSGDTAYNFYVDDNVPAINAEGFSG